MAKRKKQPEPAQLYTGKIITVVGIKKGEETWAKDVDYSRAIRLHAKFRKAGWYCKLYQEGFYQGKKIND